MASEILVRILKIFAIQKENLITSPYHLCFDLHDLGKDVLFSTNARVFKSGA